MTKLQLTPQLREVFNNKKYVVEHDYITHRQLIEFYQLHKPTESLRMLLKMTSIYNPPPSPPPKKTKEFEDLMARLRLEAKEKEYRDLVTSKTEFDTLYEPSEPQSLAQTNKELKSNVTTIINILVSVASVVYAVWYWGGSSWGLEPGIKVLLCVFFGILVLVAEVVVYMGYINKIEDAKQKERLKKEVKKVVRRIL